MKTKIIIFLIAFGFGFSGISFATHHKTELTLYKSPYFGFNDSFLNNTRCSGNFYIEGGKDYVHLRDFVYFFCTGNYTFTLDGPPGTTVTLFGNPDFRTDWGYLIVRKADEKRIWLTYINDFPTNQWRKIKGDKTYGDYEVYYKEGPQFSQNIASVKWGKWWDTLD